jgi:hypothetical protein
MINKKLNKQTNKQTNMQTKKLPNAQERIMLNISEYIAEKI